MSRRRYNRVVEVEQEFERMANAKQEVLRLLGELPEDVSYEEIQYHIYVVEKIRKAREAVQAGEVLSQEEVEKRTEKWLKK